MKFINLILLILFVYFSSAYSKDRTKIEIKNKVFPEDWVEFGEFSEINEAPESLFKPKHKQFIQMSKYSQGCSRIRL